MRVVLASGNKAKLNELSALLGGRGFALQAQNDFALETPEETGGTFVENAILKARYAARSTGFAALADDSGLVVPGLQGEPGLYSARYAGPEASDQQNIERLWQRLAEQPDVSRRAFFVCVLVFMRHEADPSPLIAEGRWHGSIAQKAEGEYGFGYDPVFFLPELDRTAAQLIPPHKADLSHRGRAVRQLLQQLDAEQ